jgi:hypothetical protein
MIIKSTMSLVPVQAVGQLFHAVDPDGRSLNRHHFDPQKGARPLGYGKVPSYAQCGPDDNEFGFPTIKGRYVDIYV